MEKISIVLYIRAARLRAGVAPIVIRVIIGGQIAKTFNTNVCVDPAHWDKKKRLVLKGEPNFQIYNNKLQNLVSKLRAEFTNQTDNGQELTKEKARNIAEGRTPSRDFYKFCQEWISQKYTRKETLRTYRSEVTKLQQYKKALAFGDINYKFLTGYKNYMAGMLKNSDNTIWKSFKFMNTMLRDAIKMKGIINQNPFDDFNRGNYKNPEKLGIELVHCEMIEPLCDRPDLTPVIRGVATRFLLMCYSGLRFEDAMTFDPAVHVVDGDRIYMKTQKAGVVLNMKLYGRLSRIIDLLKLQPVQRMTNQEFNRWLKSVAVLAGVSHMKLTCHVGRHTFGGLLAEMEIPQEQAQRLMAHKDIRSTRVYYHVKAKNLDNAMDKMNNL